MVASTAGDYDNYIAPFGHQVPSLILGLLKAVLQLCLPVVVFMLTAIVGELVVSWQVSADKRYKLFFAGGVRYDDVSYSHGVRQVLMMLFRDTPGAYPSIGASSMTCVFLFPCPIIKAAIGLLLVSLFSSRSDTMDCLMRFNQDPHDVCVCN